MPQSKFDFSAAKRAAQAIAALRNHDSEELQKVGANSDQVASEDLLALLQAACHSNQLSDGEYDELCEGEDVVELGLCATEILAHRNATEGIDSLIRFFCWAEECDEEEEIGYSGPDIIACFGAETAASFLRHTLDSKHSEWLGSVVADGVKLLGNKHPDARESLRPLIIKGLTHAGNHPPFVNAQLMMMSVDWQMTDAAEPIECAFAANRIDCGFAGDWEVIRQKLQVEGLGLPMPTQPADSRADRSESIGSGTFSSSPLFDHNGEHLEKATGEYLENACKAFAASEEWSLLVADDERAYPFDVESFLRFGLDYLGLNVDDLTPGSAEEISLELYPRKMSMDAADSDHVIDTLAAFWSFCDRVYHIPNAARIATRIEDLREDFHEALDDPGNFGIAKSFVMAGMEAGYDMTTQEGMARFMQVYNQRLAGSQSPTMKAPSTTTRKERKKQLAKIMKRKKK